MVTEDVGKRVFLSLDEARECFDELLARAEQGESFALMREGRVVVELSPGSEPAFDAEAAKEGVRRFREEIRRRKREEPTGITREEILKWRHADHR